MLKINLKMHDFGDYRKFRMINETNRFRTLMITHDNIEKYHALLLVRRIIFKKRVDYRNTTFE